MVQVLMDMKMQIMIQVNIDDQRIADAHDFEGEEVNPDQVDGGEKASWLKVKLYVYKNNSY